MTFPPDADVSRHPDQPTYIDTTVPSTARVYDAALGGKDNYEVDRELLQKMDQLVPGVRQAAVVNRNFLTRACRSLIRDMGVDQFLDCGSGLPTAENVHQVVQRHDPRAPVVYVDNDPIVLAHGRALLEDNEWTRFAPADIFAPDQLLSTEVVQQHLDWTKPMAFLQVATMHFCGSDPAAVMRSYIDALPSGSYVVFSHAYDPQDEYQEEAKEFERTYAAASAGRMYFRTREQLEPMLAGLELLEPGLVRAPDWWPVGPREEPLQPAEHCILAAVGRKP